MSGSSCLGVRRLHPEDRGTSPLLRMSAAGTLKPTTRRDPLSVMVPWPPLDVLGASTLNQPDLLFLGMALLTPFLARQLRYHLLPHASSASRPVLHLNALPPVYNLTDVSCSFQAPSVFLSDVVASAFNCCSGNIGHIVFRTAPMTLVSPLTSTTGDTGPTPSDA